MIPTHQALRHAHPATRRRHALIVGADYIEPLKKTLSEYGDFDVEHWTGRKPGDLRKAIPRNTELLVVLCDFISHGLVRKVREDARAAGVPVLYCHRSVSEVREKLRAFAEAA